MFVELGFQRARFIGCGVGLRIDQGGIQRVDVGPFD